MTRAEKAGLKAYPENISYSSVYDTMKDYNSEKRKLFIEGYEQGYKDAIDKACEYFDSLMYYVNTEELGQQLIVAFNTFDEFIEDFRKIIEQ